MKPDRSFAFDRATIAILAVTVLLTAFRIYALYESPINLSVDEAQYWLHSRTLQWGYFSTPPLIVWLIAATTSAFGDAEWAVRLAAPLAHALTALSLYALGRSIYGAWAGFWSGIGWLFIPGVWLSANIISTDTLLLLCWAVAMLSAWRLMNNRAWGWAIMLGAAIGIGLQANYEMLYFPLGLAFAAWKLAPLRAGLRQGRGILAGMLAFALILPNLLWNAQNGFVTLLQTASSLALQSSGLFNLNELAQFLAGQVLLLGPLIVAPLVWLLFRALARSSGLTDEDRFLLSFILPAFALCLACAIIARATAIWAAVAYLASIVWVSGNMMRGVNGRRLLFSATAVNALIGLATLLAAFYPVWSNRYQDMRRLRAWDETAREIALRGAARPNEAPFTAILVDQRALYFELAYYLRDARRVGAPLPAVRLWSLQADTRDRFEAIDPMRPGEGARVLVVHASPDYLPFVAADFSVFRTVEHLTIPLGGDYARNLEISVGEGFAPAPRDAAFRERLRALQQPK